MTAALRMPDRLLGLRKPSFVGSNVAGVIDQALISAANFSTMILLARVLGLSEFGSFVLVFSGMLLATNVQYCLITQPHNILGSALEGRDYVRYTSSTLGLQIGLALVLAGLAIGAAGIAVAAGWDAARLLLALAPAIFAWQLQEFVRRVFFTESRYLAAVGNDVLSYGGQVVGLLLLLAAGELGAVSALAVIAATSAVAAVVGLWQLRAHLTLGDIWPGLHARENWQFGRWLLGGNLASWTSGQLGLLLTAVFVGVSAAGALRAAQTILGPTNILLIGMDTSLTPVAARAYHEGGSAALASLVHRIFMTTWPFMAGYCVLVAVLSGPVVRFAYGGDYVQYSWLVPVFAATHMLIYAYAPVSIALRGRRHASPILEAYVAGVLVLATAGAAAIYFFGLVGTAFGLIANVVIVNAVLWSRYRSAQADDGAPGRHWRIAYASEDARGVK